MDSVNHPNHYKSKGIEAIDVIDAFGLDFCLGNVVKYVLRAGRKVNALEDIEKAKWYIDHYLERQGSHGKKEVSKPIWWTEC